ncbi:hypothetical protein [Corynebacterium casei]|uniref:hypothetical protein n=1 Tax=Corynebacterium casei TaxID=160386 RepID=UPI003FD13996
MKLEFSDVGDFLIKKLIQRLVRSQRVGVALVSNGLVSIASFLLSISVARTTSIEVFAEFSFAMVSYIFLTGLNRAALTNTALSQPEDKDSYFRSTNRTVLVAIIAMVSIAVWAATSDNSFLMVLSLSLPGLMLLDHIRTYNSAAEKPLLSLAFCAVWSVVTGFASLLSFFYDVKPLLVFIFWAASGSACGLAAAAASRVSLIPKWDKQRTETSAAVVFSADYLVGAGGAQLTTGLLGVLADTRILGAIRGSGTLLGPVNLVSTTARSLLLPFLSRSSNSDAGQFKTAVAATLVQASFLAPLLVALQFIPNELGMQLLGDTWGIASLAILPMSIDALFNVLMSTAIAGHRVSFAGSRSLIIRLAIGIPRPFIVLYCAVVWGVLGAAWSMACIAAVSSVAWWISYYFLCNKEIESS